MVLDGVSSRMSKRIRGTFSCFRSPDSAEPRTRRLNSDQQMAVARVAKYAKKIATYNMHTDAMEEALCEFSLNLLRNAYTTSQVSSPMSLAMTLAAMSVGANGKTLEELKAVLAPENVDQKDLDKFFSQLLSRISKKSTNCELKAANRIYVDADRILLDDFKAEIERLYPGILKSADFGRGEETAREINEWASEMTEGMIPGAVSAGDISKEGPLLAVNAIYFHGTWERQFDSCNGTFMGRFYFGDDDFITVKMMSSEKKYLLYAEDDTWQVLGMPYKGYEAAMFVFLPQERFGLAEAEKTLTGEKCLQLMKCAGKSVTMQTTCLPRFKVSLTLEAQAILQQLGVKSAFDRTEADFSGMDGDVHVASKLSVGEISHSAVVEVNEEGTRAAALTRVEVYGMNGEPPIPVFLANHPFLFFLVHGSSVLFAGRCADASVFDQTPIEYSV